MDDFLKDLIQVDAFSVNVVIGLALFAAWCIWQGSGSVLIGASFLPALGFFGFVSLYLFKALNFVPMDDKTASVVVAATAGMIPAALLMFFLIWCIMKVREMMTAWRFRRLA